MSSLPRLIPKDPLNIDSNIIGDYEIIKVLGNGRFGSVLLVKSIKYRQYFAMKSIKITDSVSKGNVNYLREFQTLRSIPHENVIRLYDVFEEEKKLYLVMEFCEGGTLLRLITSNKYLSIDSIKYYFQQIFSALAYCHKNNITHRDIKPENIMLTSGGKLKICDWGQSRHFDPEMLLSTYCGTFSYAAPECHKKEPYNGCKADMWSCGVVLYAAATGSFPWTGHTQAEKVFQIECGIYKIPENVDPLISEIIKQLLVVDPDKRLTAEQCLEMPLFKTLPKIQNVQFPPQTLIKSSSSKSKISNFNQVLRKPVSNFAYNKLSGTRKMNSLNFSRNSFFSTLQQVQMIGI